MAAQRRARQFCSRVFGCNLCQHGFADMEQVDALIAALNLQPGDQVLELGCGNGMVAEYIADQTGAQTSRAWITARRELTRRSGARQASASITRSRLARPQHAGTARSDLRRDYLHRFDLFQ